MKFAKIKSVTEIYDVTITFVNCYIYEHNNSVIFDVLQNKFATNC